MSKEPFIIKPVGTKKSDLVSAFPEMFVNPYANVLLTAPTLGGKTTVVYNILKKACNHLTDVYVFCPTHKNDTMWGEIKNMLEKKGCRVNMNIHFIDHDNNRSLVDEVIAGIDEKLEVDKPTNKPKPPSVQQCSFIKFDNNPKVDEIIEEPKIIKVKEKTKNLYPEHVFIYDDLSSDLTKHHILLRCMTANRHRKIMNIVCAHSLNDIEPNAWTQCHYALFFPRLSFEKMLKNQDKMGMDSEDSTTKNNKLLHKYVEATKNGKSKYDFLLVDKTTDKFYRNFNQEI